MFSKLLFLIPVIAITEIYLIIKIGGAIGFWLTVGIVLCTGMIGVILLRQQGFQLLSQLNRKLNEGQIPAAEMVEGVALMIGGVMLITPGFMTDICGFCLLLPWTRKLFVRRIASLLEKQVTSGAATGFYYSSGPNPFQQGSGFANKESASGESGTVQHTYEGEFIKVDDPETGIEEKK